MLTQENLSWQINYLDLLNVVSLVETGRIEITKEILENAITASTGWNPFSQPADQVENGKQIFAYLLSKSSYTDLDQLIQHAGNHNALDCLDVLAEHGAKNYTPILDGFINNRQADTALYMLKGGATPTTRSLELAAALNDLDILNYLIFEMEMAIPKDLVERLEDKNPAKQLLSKAMLNRKLNSRLQSRGKNGKQVAMKI